MVLTGETREYMATGHEQRSKPLHNFTLPYLKWGSQRHLRCIKVESSTSGGGAGDQRMRRRSSPNSSEAINNQHRCSKEEEGIDEFGKKIMSDLRAIADKLKESIFTKEVLQDEDEEKEQDKEMEKRKRKEREKESPAAVAAAEEARPWNLRTRRAACKAPTIVEETRANSSSSLRKDRGGLAVPGKERTKFSLSLSKKEIDDDFMALLGHRRPRRPKKRQRTVQKQLDLLFPGLYLAEVTPDSYKVPEPAENGKVL